MFTIVEGTLDCRFGTCPRSEICFVGFSDTFSSFRFICRWLFICWCQSPCSWCWAIMNFSCNGGSECIQNTQHFYFIWWPNVKNTVTISGGFARKRGSIGGLSTITPRGRFRNASIVPLAIVHACEQSYCNGGCTVLAILLLPHVTQSFLILAISSLAFPPV